MRLGNNTVIKMSDLTLQLREYGLDLFLLQQAFHVVKTPIDPYNATPIYIGKTKREIQAWIHGYRAGINTESEININA